jgi:hypothetical protein
LERAKVALNEAEALRERFVVGPIVRRRVAAAAAAAVSSVKSCFVALYDITNDSWHLLVEYQPLCSV